jgi:hypothetical protein
MARRTGLLETDEATSTDRPRPHVRAPASPRTLGTGVSIPGLFHTGNLFCLCFADASVCHVDLAKFQSILLPRVMVRSSATYN